MTLRQKAWVQVAWRKGASLMLCISNVDVLALQRLNAGSSIVFEKASTLMMRASTVEMERIDVGVLGHQA